jgi:hypothetical protein
MDNQAYITQEIQRKVIFIRGKLMTSDNKEIVFIPI